MELPSEAVLIRLSKEHVLKPFDCGDTQGDMDLSEFFTIDSKPSINELLTVTHIIETNSETIAFYSVLNDKISMEDAPSKRYWKKYIRDKKFVERKRFPSYPCVKIGRLGVHKKYQSKKIGKLILDSIKQTFIDNNRTGCRFITVDAYNRERTLKFYKDNGFSYLPNKDEKPEDKTKLMYFDLLTIMNAKSVDITKPVSVESKSDSLNPS